MATVPYTAAYDSDYEAEAPQQRYLGEHVFLWVAWALAAAFWGASMTTFVGILRAVFEPTPGVAGGADAGGVAWLLVDVIGGLVVLGLALAFGSYVVARRNRGLDPVTEAGTAALYDAIERQGGEDMTSRSPESERAARDFR